MQRSMDYINAVEATATSRRQKYSPTGVISFVTWLSRYILGPIVIFSKTPTLFFYNFKRTPRQKAHAPAGSFAKKVC